MSVVNIAVADALSSHDLIAFWPSATSMQQRSASQVLVSRGKFPPIAANFPI